MGLCKVVFSEGACYYYSVHGIVLVVVPGTRVFHTEYQHTTPYHHTTISSSARLSSSVRVVAHSLALVDEKSSWYWVQERVKTFNKDEIVV